MILITVVDIIHSIDKTKYDMEGLNDDGEIMTYDTKVNNTILIVSGVMYHCLSPFRRLFIEINERNLKMNYSVCFLVLVLTITESH